MASVFKGSINFGLINIPVNMDLAVTKEDVSFRMLHKECGSPVEYKRFCTKCQKEISIKDIAKGYEYSKDKFVIVDKEELEQFKSKADKTIDIIDFVKLSEVDPIYFEKAYYLNPGKNGEKAYQILLAAMDKTKRVAIGKLAIRDKEHLCVVRVYNNILSLSTMFFPSEIREVAGTKTNLKISETELKMAKDIVENLTTQFKPEKYVNEYKNEVMKMLNKKIKKKEFKVVETVNRKMDSNVENLFEKLKASIEETKKRKVA